MWERIKAIFAGADGLFGLSADFTSNLGAEIIGIILTAVLTAIAVQGVGQWVTNRKWTKARNALARRFIVPHLTIIEAFEHLAKRGSGLSDKDSDYFQAVLQEQRASISRSIERHSYLINPDISTAVETYRARYSAIVEQAPLMLEGQNATIHLRDDPAAKGRIFAALHEGLLGTLKVLERRGTSSFLRSIGRLHGRAHALDKYFAGKLSYQVVDALYLESDERTLLPSLVRPQET